MTDEELVALEKRSALLNSVLTDEAAANSMATCIVRLISTIRQQEARIAELKEELLATRDARGAIVDEAQAAERERCRKIADCAELAPQQRSDYSFTRGFDLACEQIADAIAGLKDEE